MGARAGKYKFGARAGKYKLGARAGKYKFGARASKYKFGARAGGQAKDREPGNTNTLTEPYLEPSQISPKMNCSVKIVNSSGAVGSHQTCSLRKSVLRNFAKFTPVPESLF